jgi:hypothetical protein
MTMEIKKEISKANFVSLRIIKPRRMRWAGHVARMGRRGPRIDYW